MSSDHFHVVKNVAGYPRLDDYEDGTRGTDLVGSSSSAAAPIIAGVWDVDDSDETKPVFEAEWDEVKYVVKGEATWKDVDTGREWKVEAGDMIWIPAGSRTTIVKSKNFSTIYVEQIYRDTSRNVQRWEAIKPRVQAMSLKFKQQYVDANSKSAKAFERGSNALPGANNRSVLFYEPFPMIFASGRDCYVKSLDGTEYLDMVSEYSAAMFGHSHPDIITALQSAVTNGINLGGHNLMEIELAEHIVSRFQSVEMVRFCNSGTEANTIALGVALSFTKRSKILAFKNSYHGGTIGFPAHPNPLNLPHDFVLGVYNDIEKTRQVLSKDIGVIILEPMQGAGGMIPATKEFLEFLRQQATDIGAILIFDEVITSRLHINGLQGYHGIYPDMTTLGKYLGGGLSFGAFGGRRDIMEKLDPRTSAETGGISHSGTYNNNTLSMAAGVAASKVLTEDKIEKANNLGDQLREGIRRIFANKDTCLINVTGLGSAVGLHFLGPLAEEIKEAFFFYMLSKGIYIGKRGFISLNIVHDEQHIIRALGSIQDFVEQVLGSQ